MRWSIQLARIGGIPTHLHVTTGVVLAALVMRFGAWGVPAGLLFFGSLLVHELAHAAAGRLYGIRTERIDLYLLGGMALMRRPGADPRQELVVAGAGPAASLLLGLTLAPVAWALGAQAVVPQVLGPVELLGAVAGLNLFMGLFNLVPALPMDGGRMFRALLSLRFGHVKATSIAAWVSRSIGAGLILFALLSRHWGFAVVGALLFAMVAHEERVAPAVQAWREEQEPGEPVEVSPDLSPVTREEFIDRYGRRYVITTKVVSPAPADPAR